MGLARRETVAITDLHASAAIAPSFTVDAWRLTQSTWRPDAASRDETLFALANGSVGVRGGFEESASPTQGTFIAGVWERAPIHHHERHFGFARTTDTRIPVADATASGLRSNVRSIFARGHFSARSPGVRRKARPSR
jgi:alpha,alpha-trehalose phosphorylase